MVNIYLQNFFSICFYAMHGISLCLVWHVMRYFVLFVQISLRESDFRSAWIDWKFKTFVLQYFCNLNSPKTLHLPFGQVNHRIHSDRKIHEPRAIGHDFICTLHLLDIDYPFNNINISPVNC